MTDALAQPGLQAARPPRQLSRLRHPGLPRRRPALRRPGTISSTWSRPHTIRGCGSSSTSSSTTPARTGSIRPARRAANRRRLYTTGRLSLRRLAAARDGQRGRRRIAGPRTASGRASCRTTGALHAGRQREPRRGRHSTTRRPSTSAPTSSRCATSASTAPGASLTDLAALLQVLDRADRLRRLPDRHAEARLPRGGTELLRHDQGVRSQSRQGRTSSWSARSPAATTRRTATSTSSERNLNAALDIGEMRLDADRRRPKGLIAPAARTSTASTRATAVMGSHRNLGDRHVSILDDHDHVFGEKLRFSSEAASDHQVVAGVALQLFTLGHPVHLLRHRAGARRSGSRRSGTGCPSGRGRTATCARRCSARPPAAERARRSGRTSRIGIRRSRASGRSAPPGTTASTSSIRPSSGSRRWPPSRTAIPCCAPAASTCGPSPGSAGRFSRPRGELVAWSRILDDEEALCVAQQPRHRRPRRRRRRRREPQSARKRDDRDPQYRRVSPAHRRPPIPTRWARSSPCNGRTTEPRTWRSAGSSPPRSWS